MEEGWILTGRVVGWSSSSRRPGWDWLDVNIGISAMLLSRHAGLSPGEDYSWMIGHEIDVKVIEVDDKQGCAYVSRRAVLETEPLLALRRKMLEALIGQTRLGRVTLVLPFGAFVDLGRVFGLLPASEFARPGESREQLKSRNEPTSNERVVRGCGIRVEIVSADLDRGRARLRLPQGMTPLR
jgi:ribosomal protein S1